MIETFDEYVLGCCVQMHIFCNTHNISALQLSNASLGLWHTYVCTEKVVKQFESNEVNVGWVVQRVVQVRPGVHVRRRAGRAAGVDPGAAPTAARA